MLLILFKQKRYSRIKVRTWQYITATRLQSGHMSTKTTGIFVCQKILWELYRFAKSIKYDRTKETLAKPLFLFYCLFVYFHLFLSLYFSVLRLVAQSTQQENSPSSRIHLCHLILMISISALRLFNAKAVAQLWGWQSVIQIVPNL